MVISVIGSNFQWHNRRGQLGLTGIDALYMLIYYFYKHNEKRSILQNLSLVRKQSGEHN